MSSQHRIENVTVRERPLGCELRCDGEGFTVCSEVLFVECPGSSSAREANVKYTDCGGPEMPVVLSPVVAGDAQIIQIDGACYERVGATQDAITDTEFDYEFDTCQDCSDIDLNIRYTNCADPSDIIYIDDAVTVAAIVEVSGKCYSSTEYVETAADVFAVDNEFVTCESCASTFSAIEYVDCAAAAPSLVIRESVAPGQVIVRVDEVCYSSTSSTLAATTHTSIDYSNYTDCADCAATSIQARYKSCVDGVAEVIIPENQVPATDSVIEINSGCYEFFEFTEDASTNAAPDASHTSCGACETYRLYEECILGSSAVVISSQYTSSQTIKIGGVCYDFISTTTDPVTHTGVDIDAEFADCATCAGNNRQYVRCDNPASSQIVSDATTTSEVVRIDGVCYEFDQYVAAATTAASIDYEFEFCSTCDTTTLSMRFEDCDGIGGEYVFEESDAGGITGITSILQSSSECYSFVEYTTDVAPDTVSTPLVSYDDCDCCADMCCEVLLALNVDGGSAVDATEQHQTLTLGTPSVSNAQAYIGTDSITGFAAGSYVTINTRGNGAMTAGAFPNWGNTYDDPRHTSADLATADYHSCFNFGTENFEIGIAWRTTDNTQNQNIFANWGSANGECWVISFEPAGWAASGGKTLYSAWTEAGMAGLGPDGGYWGCGGTPTINNDTWYWLEWNRVGNVMQFSLDGTVLGSRAFAGSILPSANTISIGKTLNAGDTSFVRGFVDAPYIRRNTGITLDATAPTLLYAPPSPYK